jgi:hypothetical protein
MKKRMMLVAVVLLLAAFGFALDVGIAAMIAFHFTTRTIIEVRSNAG